VPLGVPRLVYELKTVAVEVGDVGGVVAGDEGSSDAGAGLAAADINRSA
jgi:hypothetical protein